jgi:tripartite-type tricarboxylate transporter receptor subunit TctC
MKSGTGKRSLLASILVCMVLLVTTNLAWSQSGYPNRPINLLISYSPGTVDTAVRFVATKAETHLGQPFVISNNGGGASTVAAGIVAKKPPDGYNILGCASTALIRIPQFRTVPYKLDDLVPIMHFAAPVLTPIVVQASSPFKTFKDLVAYARKSPGKMTYGTPGVGSPMHLAMEYIAKREGVTFTHIPYPGGTPALMALLGGHLVAQMGSGECIPHVQNGTLRILATAAEKRAQTFPNVPTTRELGYDVINESVFMFAAPKGTPQNIIDKLDQVFHTAMGDPEFAPLMAKMEFEPSYRNSADTKKYLQDAYERIGRMIRELKIVMESNEKPK